MDATIQNGIALNPKSILTKVDTTPTADSNNPVSSDGVKTYVDQKDQATNIRVDTLNTQIAASFFFKGSSTFAELPASGNTINDTYYVTDSDKECWYSWNGTDWIKSSMSQADYAGLIAQLKADISAEYSTSKTYKVGDYCLYGADGVLYICKIAVTTAGAFDSNKWQAISFGEAVGDLVIADDTQPTSLANKIWLDTDPNLDTVEVITEEDLGNIVAGEFDSSSAYAVGDYCIHDAKLYVAKTATAANDGWIAARWQQVTVMGTINDQVGELKTQLSTLLPTIKIKSLVLNKYGIDSNNGVQNVLANRLHTAIAMCHTGDIVGVPNGYMFWIAYYSVEDGYIGSSYAELGDKWSSNTAEITHDGLFSINIKKNDNSDFTESECYALNNTLFLYSTSEMRVNGIVFGAGHIITNNNSDNWSLHGDDFYFNNFNNQKQTITTRWRTEERVSFAEGASIEIASGYRFYIFKYVNGNVINVGWQTDRYVFDKDVEVRIVVDTISDTKISYTEWPDLNDIIFIQNDSDVIKIESDINKIENNLEPLHIGSFINGHLTASGVVDDTYTNYRISTSEIVAFPIGRNRKLKVKINSGYLFSIRCGADSRNLDTSLYWFGNNDIVNIPDTANYYAISVCNADGTDAHITTAITPDDNIGLEVLYKGSFDILTQNDEATRILSNARLFFSTSQTNTINKYAIIAHTSDCHGDYKRVDNFLKFCDNCGADAACITGDIVSYQPTQGIKWFNDLLLAHSVTPAVCTGNHDVYSDTMDDGDIYDFMFADIAEKIGNTTNKTWYYKDIATKKIRIISVNLYQYGGGTGTHRWRTHFTEEQLTWIVNTIKSTPENYGIVILSHASQVSLDNAKDNNYPDFFQNARLYNDTHNEVSGGVPLYDIVDAFISRTTLSKTYTQVGTPSSISVNADFTDVDNSIEFIAHLTGHFHQDSICYVPNRTNKQLMLNVTCTNAIYGGPVYPYLADIQDQARDSMDATQDAFNVYVIDRDNKVVKVIRIGNTMTYQMQDRQYMEIPYAD